MVGEVTVIIPSRDRYRDLRRCLVALRENDLGLLREVIIVDDGSVPPVRDAVELPGLPVRLLRNETSQGAMRSRNRAALLAESAVLAFLDDDALPRADWLATITAELTAERGGVTGRVLPFDDGLVSSARQARYLERYRSLQPGTPVTFFAGGNGAVWRELFNDVGGFSVTGTGGDNSLVSGLGQRGRQIHFVPEMVIVHRNGKGVGRAFRDAFDAGLQHPQPLPVGAALRELARGSSAGAGSVRALNRALQVAHSAGRGLAGARGHLGGRRERS